MGRIEPVADRQVRVVRTDIQINNDMVSIGLNNLRLNRAMNATKAKHKSKTFNITGMTNLVVGEFIQFTGDPKVYLVTSAGTQATTTTGTNVSVEPKLRINISAGTVIKFAGNITMNARYDIDSALGITFTDGILSDPGTIKLIEDLA